MIKGLTSLQLTRFQMLCTDMQNAMAAERAVIYVHGYDSPQHRRAEKPTIKAGKKVYKMLKKIYKDD